MRPAPIELPATPDPVRLERLREAMKGAGYTTPGVCRRLEIPTLYHFETLGDGRDVARDLAEPIDVWIRLFLDAEGVAGADAAGLLSVETIDLLRDLGLVAAEADGIVRGQVLLYPTEWLYIVSDLPARVVAAGKSGEEDDAVFPALTKNTQQFLSSLPATRCTRMLDLCSGTGVAALLGSVYSEQVWATDITERSVRFARFNAVLNGIANVTPVQGDLYEPLDHAQFDRIVAHPPYMPSLGQRHIFKDGGEDGEQVTRGILAGLSEHLLPGGCAYITCVLSERGETPVEVRVREMLGPNQGEFDVALIVMGSFHPMEQFGKQLWSGRLTADDLAYAVKNLQRAGVDQLVYSTIVLQRCGTDRSVFTVRRRRGATTVGRHIDWLLRWETEAVQPGFADRVLEARLRPANGAGMTMRHRLDGGAWAPEEWVLTTDTPFSFEAKCAPWAALLMTNSADQRRTVREHLQLLQEGGHIPRDAPEAEFARLAAALVAGGLLSSPDLPQLTDT